MPCSCSWTNNKYKNGSIFCWIASFIELNEYKSLLHNQLFSVEFSFRLSCFDVLKRYSVSTTSLTSIHHHYHRAMHILDTPWWKIQWAPHQAMRMSSIYFIFRASAFEGSIRIYAHTTSPQHIWGADFRQPSSAPHGYAKRTHTHTHICYCDDSRRSPSDAMYFCSSIRVQFFFSGRYKIQAIQKCHRLPTSNQIQA